MCIRDSLYAVNGGLDEKSRVQVGPEYKPITSEYLEYDELIRKYEIMMDWLAGLYVNTLNLIQYMHDKYYYEAAEMALIDTDVRRTFATGIAGFSHVVDSLSAVKYAKVKVIRDEEGVAVDFETEGDFPRYGNDDDRADDIAVWLLHTFLEKLKKYPTYRNSEPTTSILTITSNAVSYTHLIRNGHPVMAKITGCGCMLSSLTAVSYTHLSTANSLLSIWIKKVLNKIQREKAKKVFCS